MITKSCILCTHYAFCTVRENFNESLNKQCGILTEGIFKDVFGAIGDNCTQFDEAEST